MKAQNLSISIPNFGCNKHCPYCVSAMTGYVNANPRRIMEQIPKVKALCERIGITTVLLTGKGEPLVSAASVRWIRGLLRPHFRDFIVELQTNGLVLLEAGGGRLLANLRHWGLNVLAFSMDSFRDITRFAPVFARAVSLGLVVRIALNAVNDFSDVSFSKVAAACRASGVSQLTLRRITVPERVVDTAEARKTKEWIERHSGNQIYQRLIREFEAESKRLIRTLTTGAQVFDLDGLSFTCSDYCVQERNREDDIRSIIFAEDGHCYDGWDCRASVLF
jgi:molybdenum cofactor biosynthesis enzyme MoaA